MKVLYTKLLLILLLLPIAAMIHAQAGKIPSTVAFTIDEQDLIPEGITYDPQTRLFFLSSINKEKIISVAENGVVTDFIRPGQDSILQTLGMKVDVSKRRLWVVSNKVIDKKNISAIHVYDIDKKVLIKKFIIVRDGPQLFNDLVLTTNGNAFITDTFTSRIYSVSASLEKPEIFIESDSLLKWSNGITISPDNKVLYVASGSFITMINIKTRVMEKIGNSNNTDNSGIDGLVFYKGDLIGIVNGREDAGEIQIARYKLSPDLRVIQSMSVIDKGNPLFNMPTTCVIANDNLFCLANTSLMVFLQDQMNEKDKLHGPVVLKYSLEN